MFVALDRDGNKIWVEDAVEGERYFCPCPKCGKELTIKARKSDAMRTHFAHKKGSQCLDSWMNTYDMSEWHKNWQRAFPIEYNEVYLENNGEVHRADVLIEDLKVVIEFQHSPMSGEEFEKRNAFYKSCGYKMVWVFDVKDRTKLDDINYLVWKRKTSLFSKVKTVPDEVYFQHLCFGDPDALLKLAALDSKEIKGLYTVMPIMPENFLKTYGMDNDAISMDEIFSLTRDYLVNQRNSRPRIYPVYQTKTSREVDRIMRGRSSRRRRF